MPFLVVTGCDAQGGGAVWGHAGAGGRLIAVGGRGRHFAAFGEPGECGELPHTSAEPRPARSGDPAPTTGKKAPWGSLGVPSRPTKGSEGCVRTVRAPVFFVCLRVAGGTGRGAVCFGCVVWGLVSLGGRLRRVCSGNYYPRRFLCFYFFF